MVISEKRLAANRRNWEIGRQKSRESLHRRKEYNNRLVECTAICEHCHKTFTKMIRQIDLDKNRLPKHCSRSCANSRVRTDELKAKMRKKMTGVKFIDGKRVLLEPVVCQVCGQDIPNGRNNHRKYCSIECRRLHNARIVDSEYRCSIQQYRRACSFKFNLATYPDEFDFELIKQYGFYSPKNKKDNPNGVTRDHMYSVREGFTHKVSPLLISHPANCQLMLHLDNVSKNKKCSITLDELKERIRIWEEKYGHFEPCKWKDIRNI